MPYPEQNEKFVTCHDTCLFRTVAGRIRRLPGDDYERRIRRRYLADGARMPVATIRIPARDPRHPNRSTDIGSLADARALIAPLMPLLDYAGVPESDFIDCIEICVSRR